MDYKDFCIWLKGYVEIHKHPPISEEWEVIVSKLESISDDLDQMESTKWNSLFSPMDSTYGS
jgi:hypothetical protein